MVERKSMTQVQVNKFLVNPRSAFSGLKKLLSLTMAAIDGPALWGGLEMALCCDLLVAGWSPILVIFIFRYTYLADPVSPPRRSA